jgi:hypothetical protein
MCSGIPQRSSSLVPFTQISTPHPISISPFILLVCQSCISSSGILQWSDTNTVSHRSISLTFRQRTPTKILEYLIFADSLKMASSGLGDAPLAPLEHDATYQICHKCKKVLPIHHYTKDGRCLKTCFECRDRHQIVSDFGLIQYKCTFSDQRILEKACRKKTSCRGQCPTKEFSRVEPHFC